MESKLQLNVQPKGKEIKFQINSRQRKEWRHVDRTLTRFRRSANIQCVLKEGLTLNDVGFIPQELSRKTGEKQVCGLLFPNLPPQIVTPVSSCLMRRRRTNTKLFIELRLEGEELEMTWNFDFTTITKIIIRDPAKRIIYGITHDIVQKRHS